MHTFSYERMKSPLKVMKLVCEKKSNKINYYILSSLTLMNTNLITCTSNQSKKFRKHSFVIYIFDEMVSGKKRNWFLRGNLILRQISSATS